MIQTIRKAWNIPELRKKIVFTLLILLIYRIGNAIPVPYVDVGALSEYLNSMKTTVLGLYNVMSGGAFAQATVFALSIQPYICLLYTSAWSSARAASRSSSIVSLWRS